MTEQQQKQKRPLATRIFSTEGVLALVGLYCLGSGAVTGEVMSLFWGGTILVGLVILHLVRKKDWQAHWQELERERARREEYERRRKDSEG